jgi:hypothetical protein|tara:strand:- start:9784 stop:9918 length:135 start_codon:yes stop_codon:yes gene_type:complete
MREKDLKKIIATDRYNLLRDKESRIGYWLKKIKYRIELWRSNNG